MNTLEARQLIKKELADYEGKTYVDLASLIGEDIHSEKQGPSGAQYQVEINIFWDSTPDGIIRVMGSIDDGGWHAFAPLTVSILKFPPVME